MLRNSQIFVTDPQAGLKITEIFYSIQGEANQLGWPTVFVRLTGCPLRCTYCDTTYSFTGGNRFSLEDIISQIQNYNTKHICITGGEPLSQPNSLVLMQMLCNLGYKVSLETSGALDVSKVDSRVSKVLDLKTPFSGEVKKNDWDNLKHLTQNDQIKFVICDFADFLWAKEMTLSHHLNQLVSSVWFSPALTKNETNNTYNTQFSSQLADWILEHQLPVRFQLQLHKMLWQDAKGK